VPAKARQEVIELLEKSGPPLTLQQKFEQIFGTIATR